MIPAPMSGQTDTGRLRIVHNLFARFETDSNPPRLSVDSRKACFPPERTSHDQEKARRGLMENQTMKTSKSRVGMSDRPTARPPALSQYGVDDAFDFYRWMLSLVRNVLTKSRLVSVQMTKRNVIILGTSSETVPLLEATENTVLTEQHHGHTTDQHSCE